MAQHGKFTAGQQVVALDCAYQRRPVRPRRTFLLGTRGADNGHAAFGLTPGALVAGGTQLYAIIGAPRSGLAGDRAALQVDVGWARRPVGMPPSMWDASFGPEAQVMLWLP